MNNTLAKLGVTVNWLHHLEVVLVSSLVDFPQFHEVQTSITIHPRKLQLDAFSHQTVSAFLKSSLSHEHQRAAFDRDSE